MAADMYTSIQEHGQLIGVQRTTAEEDLKSKSRTNGKSFVKGVKGRKD